MLHTASNYSQHKVMSLKIERSHQKTKNACCRTDISFSNQAIHPCSNNSMSLLYSAALGCDRCWYFALAMLPITSLIAQMIRISHQRMCSESVKHPHADTRTNSSKNNCHNTLKSNKMPCSSNNQCVNLAKYDCHHASIYQTQEH